MIEKPNISDEKIIVALNENYSIQANHIEFLPIGNDSSAFAYRVEAENQTSCFLKLKKRISNLAGLFVPRFLKDSGIEQVVAPLPTKTRGLSVKMDEFDLILYPFIMGNEAMQVGMTDAQWTEFGAALKRIHATKLDGNTLPYVAQESFTPKWSRLAKTLHEQVNTQNYDDPYGKELAIFWKRNNEKIQTLIERAEMIGKRLQQTDLDFVLCHADIHTANILITQEQELFIVDWDDILFAPKERDLMFVLGKGTAETREEHFFFKGYGNVNIDPLVLSYYGYEWCVQEIADFGERVFLTTDTGENTKKDSVEAFMKLFSQGDVVESAFNNIVEI
ncbi:MAG TPA: aminoglycoside phosphotransferase family protein [Anaerolineales bacterium]|nr:aminoglycoside phosphotransferase family protein [Anaerolineales bacterium]